ncbi:MAG: hypothetical protein QXW70_02520 [Candidatus Anstonellales archaeon]
MPATEKPFTLQISPKPGQDPIVTMIVGNDFTTVVLSDSDGNIIEKWNVSGKKVVVERAKL